MKNQQPPAGDMDTIIDLALTEDTGHGDVTSEALIPPDLQGKAIILSKAEGVLAGIGVAGRVFRKVDPSLKTDVLFKDGSRIKPGDILATVSGRIRSILRGERVMLNFLQRLSGIASVAAEYVSRTEGLKTVIVDTRKTTPGLRALEKYAVRAGGAQNHPIRMHLGDGILIKDNHLTALRALGMDLKGIVARAKENAPPGVLVEIEVTTLEEAMEAATTGADFIMLDNMSPEEMRRTIERLPEGVKTEASGGINLDNLRAVAETGVDVISVGALTHSVKSLDISLEIEPGSLKLPG